MYRSVFLLLSVLTVTEAGSQSTAGFFKKIEVKKSFDNATDKTKPAVMSFTIPAGAKNYFIINGGVAYRMSKLTSNKKIKLDLFSVYNRNNQIKKEQKNIRAGLAFEGKYLFYQDQHQIIPKDFFFKVNFSAPYMKNWIDSSCSLGGLLYFTPYFRLSEKIKIGKPVMSGSGTILSYLNTVPGLEYQNNITTPASKNKGALARLYLYAAYEWYYRWRKTAGDDNSDWVNLFELSANYTYRKDFTNNTGVREGVLPLFIFNAAFYPFRNSNIAFGAAYQNGSDPVNGINKQEFWQFVFKFKKDIE